jgi:predicted RNA methylase
MKKVRKMLIMANIKSGELVYDLGCGDGRVLITAAREFDARAVGIEIDPLRYIWSQARITLLGLRERVQVFYGDFFHQDLSKADIVTCYLLQSTNDKLIEKLNKELRLGARVISNTSLFRNSNLSTRMTSTKSLCIEKMQIADF